jgi:hypothetical protein
MFFSVDRETLRWNQKTLSRARRSGGWAALFAREACWTPQTFAALVDEHDRLLLEGRNELAAEIGSELPRLADRIRTSLCPGHQLGKTSLAVWALAVHGSGLRAKGAAAEAGRVFAAAFDKADAFAKENKGVFGWTRAELERRFAHHLLHENDRRALDSVSSALAGFAEHPVQQAECYNLRGVCRAFLDDDGSGAVHDFGMALSLADPGRGERSLWSLQAALHNLALQLVKGGPCSLESLSQARRMLLASRSWLGKGMDARKLRSLWVEGLLVYRIGWNRHGERLLERARQGFHKLGRQEEHAVATLDLAVMLIEDGEAQRAAGLLAALGEAPRLQLMRPNLDRGQIHEARRQLVESLSRPSSRLEGRRASV